MAPHQALVAVCLLPTVKAAKEVEIDVENLVKAEAQMLIYLFYAALFLYPVLRWSIKRYTSKIASMTQEYMDKMSSKISETKKANVSSSKRSGGVSATSSSTARALDRSRRYDSTLGPVNAESAHAESTRPWIAPMCRGPNVVAR